jgi:hypothetical protein
MAQVTNGLLLGKSVYIFVEAGAPSASSDPNVANAAIGSLYLQADGTTSVLWVLQASGWAAK